MNTWLKAILLLPMAVAPGLALAVGGGADMITEIGQTMNPLDEEDKHQARAEASQECRDASRRTAAEGFCFDAFFNTAHDGTKIDMTVYVPGRAALAAAARTGQDRDDDGLPDPVDLGDSGLGYAPLLIHSHGFGGSKQANLEHADPFVGEQAARDLWRKGYFVISFSQRGFGESGDEIGMMNPDLEGKDTNEVVDWAIKHLREGIYEFQFDAANPQHVSSVIDHGKDKKDKKDKKAKKGRGDWARASLLMADNGMRVTRDNPDPALGGTGYSYGGGFQYTATHAAQAAGNQRWDAINPQGTWLDLRYSLAQNDVPKTGWINIMTAFALDGSRRPLPPLLVQARAEADVLNRITGETSETFLKHSSINYCDPVRGTSTRGVDVFHIQGLQDTLFNFNEGYENAVCASGGGNDVRFLAVTGGHLLPAISPANHSGNTGMSIDEVVHCGTDGAGRPKRLKVKDLIVAWYEEKLRHQKGAADIVPDVCIVQENLDPSDHLADCDFHRQGGFDPVVPNFNKHRYAKEGVVYDSLDDVMVGGERKPFTAEIMMGPQGTSAFVSLHTSAGNEVIAGIPTLKLEVSPPHPDPVFFVGVGIRRGAAGPFNPATDRTGSVTNSVAGEIYSEFDRQQAEGGSGQRGTNDVELVHAQLTAIRSTVFPWEGRSDPLGAQFGQVTINDGVTPIWFGCPPNVTECERGRMAGVSSRLMPGDEVGLYFFGSHVQYASHSGRAGGPALITGDVELPLMPAGAPPVSVNPPQAQLDQQCPAPEGGGFEMPNAPGH